MNKNNIFVDTNVLIGHFANWQNDQNAYKKDSTSDTSKI